VTPDEVVEMLYSDNPWKVRALAAERHRDDWQARALAAEAAHAECDAILGCEVLYGDGWKRDYLTARSRWGRVETERDAALAVMEAMMTMRPTRGELLADAAHLRALLREALGKLHNVCVYEGPIDTCPQCAKYREAIGVQG
jgi:hypothetical protein